MKTLRIQIGLLALLAVAVPAAAQTVYRPIVANFDLDHAHASTYQYSIFGERQVPPADGALITTTGASSATITAVSGAPFTDVTVGAQLEILTLGGGLETRYVLTRASAVSITVNAVITIPTVGRAFTYRNVVSGTGDGDGWMNVSKFSDKTWLFQVEQLNATGGIDFRVECRLSGPTARPVVIYPPSGGTGACGTGNYTAAATRCAHTDDLAWESCRLGLKILTADDGGDTGANLEQVTVNFVGVPR